MSGLLSAKELCCVAGASVSQCVTVSCFLSLNRSEVRLLNQWAGMLAFCSTETMFNSAGTVCFHLINCK